jgi:uncharacterized protein involved in exopolysaccharide biosynthesis
MSRIEDVFKRITGAAADPRPTPALERFSREPAPQLEENKVSTFIAPGPHAVDPKPQVRQKTPSAPPPIAPPPITETPVAAAQLAHQAKNASDPEPDVSGEKLIDVRKIFDYVGFLGRSLRRRAFLALGAFALAFGLTITGAALMPKTYYISTKLLAQRNAVMTALSNPGRAVPWDADAPTRAAAETVLRRDNLIALIEKTDLLREWERTREPILRLKDRLMVFLTRYHPTPEDKLDAMILLLESRMNVIAGPVGDGTVTIDLFWRDPEMGFRLVEEAQQAFLDARQKAETSAINESIRILEDYSQELHGNINATLTELERTQNRRAASVSAAPRVATLAELGLTTASVAPSPSTVGDLPSLAGSFEPDPEVARLNAEITSKKQEMTRLQNDQDRQVADLRAQLSRLTTVYAPAHPNVIAAQQSLAAASHDSPQIVTLRNDIEDLERDLRSREDAAADRQIKAVLESRAAGDNKAPVEPVVQLPERPVAPPPARVFEPSNSTNSSEFASLRLRSELNQLESVLERTDGARIELKVSQAAFKYRYTVIRPAQVPKDPIAPNLRTILIAGFFGSLVMGVLSAVGKDLLSNRILETWQVERQLGLPVLGTLEIV